MTKKLFRVLRFCLINVVIILVLLIILDPLIGYFIDEKEGIERQINFKENKPYSKLKISTLKSDRYDDPIMKITDKYGFILGPNEKSTENINFIFLGSSTVESENVSADKRYPYLSIKKLNEKLGTNFNSRNAGVGGNLLSTSNLALTTKIVDLRPQYVFLSSSLIDMLYLSKNASYWEGSKKYLVHKGPFTSMITTVKDYFFPNLWLQIRKFLVSSGKSQFHNEKFSPMDKKRILGQYSKQLEVFISTCLIYDINPILSTDYHVPKLVKKGLIKRKVFTPLEANFYLENLIPELNLLIKEKAKKYNIPIIELHQILEKNENFVNDNDGVHLTNKGSEEVSEVISNFLLKNIKHEEI